MKNFTVMRFILFVTLLSCLILPASAAYGTTDSTNLSNIKSYVYDIRVAVTSGNLYRNISSMETSLKNISSNLSSIWTKVQSIDNRLDTNNTKTDTTNTYLNDLKTLVGTNSTTSKNSLNKLLDLIYGKASTSDSYLGNIKLNAAYINSKVATTNSTLTSIDRGVDTGNDYLSDILDSLIKGDFATETTLAAFKKSAATEATLKKVATEETQLGISKDTSSLVSSLSSLMETSTSFAFSRSSSWRAGVSSSGFFSYMTGHLYYDYMAGGKQPTLIKAIRDLRNVLASDDDQAIKDSQKENTEQVTQDFLNGGSGSSLGKGDFGNLSSMGSTAKDLTSLNGQASVGSFTSGLSDADSSAQGWFSEETRSSLDAVTNPAATYDADDPDPYHMGDFISNYDWVFGGDD